MKYEHVGFNSEWVASKTFKEFMEHEKHHGFSKEKMEEIYKLCKAKHSNQESSVSDLQKEG